MFFICTCMICLKIAMRSFSAGLYAFKALNLKIYQKLRKSDSKWTLSVNRAHFVLLDSSESVSLDHPYFQRHISEK